MENANVYLKILVEEIHSVVVATTDEKGLPTTRVIDMMHFDSDGLYFLTAKGKAFYHHLKRNGYISLSGVTGDGDSMTKKAISISGSLRNIGSEKLEKIFALNRYMSDIYPTAESKKALEVFCIYRAKGDYFDLSTKPISRGNFAFGGEEVEQFGFFIHDNCTACGACLEGCPTECIVKGEPYKILQEQCLHCGNCYTSCPEKAISRGDFSENSVK